jgi:hypothetical protein
MIPEDLIHRHLPRRNSSVQIFPIASKRRTPNPAPRDPTSPPNTLTPHQHPPKSLTALFTSHRPLCPSATVRASKFIDICSATPPTSLALTAPPTSGRASCRLDGSVMTLSHEVEGHRGATVGGWEGFEGEGCGRRRCAKTTDISHLHHRQAIPVNDSESNCSPG